MVLDRIFATLLELFFKIGECAGQGSGILLPLVEKNVCGTWWQAGATLSVFSAVCASSKCACPWRPKPRSAVYLSGIEKVYYLVENTITNCQSGEECQPSLDRSREEWEFSAAGNCRRKRTNGFYGKNERITYDRAE